jgi:hypothetical protein
MPGLQDLLILRQLQNEADPTFSAFQALAQGVGTGIETARVEAKAKKTDADAFNTQLNKLDQASSRFGDKFNIGMQNGRLILSSKDKLSAKAPSSTRLAAGKLTGIIPQTDEESVRIISQKTLEESERKIKSSFDDQKIEERNFVSKQANDIQDDFLKTDVNENFVAIEKAAQDIESVMQLSLEEAKIPKTGKEQRNLSAIDLALVVSFNKMLDPGSVVRESEFNRTAENVSLINKLEGKYKKIFEGGVGITDADRIEIQKVSKLLLDNARKSLKKTSQPFIKRAKFSDVPLDMIFDEDMIASFINAEEVQPVVNTEPGEEDKFEKFKRLRGIK